MARLSSAFQEEIKSQVGDLHLVIKPLLFYSWGLKWPSSCVWMYWNLTNYFVICVLFMSLFYVFDFYAFLCLKRFAYAVYIGLNTF